MVGHLLSHLEAPAVAQVLRDPGGPEGVASNLRGDVSILGSAPDSGRRQIGSWAALRARQSALWPSGTANPSCRPAMPPAAGTHGGTPPGCDGRASRAPCRPSRAAAPRCAALGVDVLHPHLQRCTHAGKGVDHRAISARSRRPMGVVRSIVSSMARASSAASTGVFPLRTECCGLLTELAGFIGMT